LALPRRQRAHPGILVTIAMGGMLGTGVRAWVSASVHLAPDTFPWSTFWVNVIGSFILGVGLALILERFPPSRYLRPFFATGFCGGFTTFSTFAVEADLLVQGSSDPIALAYLGASVVGGLGAALVGILAGRALPLELAPLFGHRISPRRQRAS
jgi:CrcB protein